MNASFRLTARRGWIFVLFLSCLWAAPGWAVKTEVGFSAISHFSPTDYGGHSQVFQSVQDAAGIVYMANFAAVFAYDGERWTRIHIPDSTFLYGLALLEDDSIAVSGVGQIGLLEADGKGSRVFRSLLPEVPEEYRDGVDEVWDLYATDQGVFFFGRRLMMRWKDGEMRVWPFETEKVIYGYWSGSSIYVQNLDHGLYRLDGDEVVMVSEEPLFIAPGPRMLIDWKDGTKLVATMKEGLWLLDGSALSRFPTEADAVLAEGTFNRGLVLPDGRLALGTFNKGVVVLSEEGEFLQHLHEGNGLAKNSILHLSVDREMGLWCSLNTGLARVDMTGALSYYDLRSGLPSVSVTEIVRFAEEVYLASGEGMFRLSPVEPPDSPRWERVVGVEGEMFDLVEHDGALWGAAAGQVKRIFGREVETVWDGTHLVRVVEPSTKDASRIYVGTRMGLGVVAKVDGVWQQSPLVGGAEFYVQSVLETPDGDVWVGTQRNGIWRFRSAGEGLDWVEQAEGEQFGEEAGLPERTRFSLSYQEGRLFASSFEDRFVWDESAGRFELVDDLPERPPLEGWSWDVYVWHEYSDVAWGSVYSIEGAADDFTLYFGRDRVDENGERRFDWVPPEIFEPISGVLYEMVEGEDEPVLWVGGWGGLLRWELSKAPLGVMAPELEPLIRKVSSGGGEALVWGSAEESLVLDYSERALRFEYAAPVTAAGVRPEYRTRLDGFEAEWTEWGSEVSREFTNLVEGSYRFLVEARTPLGVASRQAVWEFGVRPPWFRSVGAYAGYLAVFGILVWLLVRWRLAAVERENARLEGLVAARTTDLQASEGKLRQARDEAERANRAKSSFLANMSHELRTPLNGILGYAQVLARDTDLTPRNRERVGIVESSGKHLLKLINEVLDLSKIEAGRMEVKLGPVALDGLLRTASGIFHQRVDEQGLEYSVTQGPGLPEQVLLDEQKVGQVLFNFLGNAVKFTERGRIELRVSRGSAADRLRFSVSDTGPGISAEDQRDIFEPFKQLNKESSEEPGTGLGLAISSKLVAAMGGEIGVESELGEGSTFWCELPLVEVAQGGRSLAAAPVRQRCAGAARRILVVDDVAVNRGVVREMLKPLGFEVEEADGGERALALVAERRPDLVLLDMRMEPVDGAETVRRLRASERGRDLPVLAFSASAIGFTREDARALGCDDFITKPFEWDELLDRLTELLGLSWETGSVGDAAAGSEGGGLCFAEEDLEALRALAHRGEPAGLKAKLQEVAASDPELEPLVGELLQLVARFRIRELSERLSRMEARS